MIKNENGSWLTKEEDIRAAFSASFQSLFNPPNLHHPAGDNLDIAKQWLNLVPKISDKHISILNKPFTNKKIKHTAFSMKPIKSPGLDGVPPFFIQANWHLIGRDMREAVHNFFHSGFLLKEVHKTFFTLILKLDKAESISRFRPISLCNSTYKIISKCLVSRLKRFMKDIVGEFQNAFILGRVMADNSLLAHALLHWVKHKSKGNSSFGILKIDLSKAYDKISWTFLRDVLTAYGFPPRWIQ